MKFIQPILLLTFMLFLVNCDRNSKVIKIGSDEVREGNFSARALSPTQLYSDYPMILEGGIDQPIIFKLSLNGKDNEGGYGADHYLSIPEGVTEFHAPLLQFGQETPKPELVAPKITQISTAHFRVDLHSVLKEFQTQGYFITNTGDTVFADKFQGLYLAGGIQPLNWIWDDPSHLEAFRFDDSDQDSIYEISIRFDPTAEAQGERNWELSKDLSALPHFSSPDAPLLEAITNLALEEALMDIREDGTFSAGKEWPGVWTRDISFAGQLSLAYLFPEQMKASLRAKLNADRRIIQDTGTGGSWPISSDRHVWTLAAWEVFLATGDKDWLDEIKAPVISALQEDILWNRDPISGMILGETSFEDWREQTYPPWMTPADIHSSQALSTNIIFKRALEIGLVLARGQKNITSTWPELINRLDDNMLNHFWNESLDAPASYNIASPVWIHSSHRDLLAESLGILYSRPFSTVGSKLASSYPRTTYGSPVISHQLVHSPPYHNKAIWPFLEAYSLLAAKKVGNQKVYMHGFNSLIRAAALFQTHRENFHYTSGRPDQTEINSNRQLWSVAGWLGAIYKGLFGISIGYDFDRDEFELNLEPNNPFKWHEFSLNHLTLHKTPIHIQLRGNGSIIESMAVNGTVHTPGDPLPLRGDALEIRIELGQDEASRENNITFAEHILPNIPNTTWASDTLSWISHSSQVLLEVNGFTVDTLEQSPVIIPDSLDGFFCLVAVDSTGALSLPSYPHYQGPSASLVLNTEAPYYIELGKETAYISLSFSLPNAGNYLLRFIYSNGSGPINTGSTCGLAKLKINNWWLEKMVSFPHTASWDQWRTSSWQTAFFQAGTNHVTLDQESLPVSNMDGNQNLFRIQAVEIIPIMP
ncbi:MAG: hypothetical protein K9N35_03700 [Candidatus Marinimicrobia bacterium]|nr:hypothetical protein [Candidatus Neomarinimicrobiota bacterium]